MRMLLNRMSLFCLLTGRAHQLIPLSLRTPSHLTAMHARVARVLRLPIARSTHRRHWFMSVAKEDDTGSELPSHTVSVDASPLRRKGNLAVSGLHDAIDCARLLLCTRPSARDTVIIIALVCAFAVWAFADSFLRVCLAQWSICRLLLSRSHRLRSTYSNLLRCVRPFSNVAHV